MQTKLQALIRPGLQLFYVAFFSRSAAADYLVHISLYEDLANAIKIDFGILGLLKVLFTEGLSAAMAHVRKEISAGRHEMAVMREDQINDQLRTLRAMSRQLARTGRSHDAQRVISVILDLEAAKERLHAQQRELEKKSK